MNQSGNQNQGGYATGQGGYQTGSGSNKRGGSLGGNNAARNNKYCYFCKLQGHRQEECQRRINENKPCRDAQGQTYWPRIYFMDKNTDTKSVNAIYHAKQQIQDYDEELFNTARVNFDQKYDPRTAALPQTNSGFQ